MSYYNKAVSLSFFAQAAFTEDEDLDNDDEFNFSTQRPPGESEEKDQFGEPGDDDFPEDYPTLKQQMKFREEEPGDSILEETRSDTVLIDETLNKTATESMENLPPCSESILLEQTVSANSPDPNEITLVEEDDEISFMVRK